MNLNRENVAGLPAYPEKVLQFGEGNFLRAFVDWMIWKMNKKIGFNAGVTIVQPIERGIVDMLEDQNGLYHLYLQGINNGESVSNSYLIDCIQKCVNPYTQFDSYQKSIKNPDLRFVVSNTTEAGITYNEDDKFDDKPQKSFPGKVTKLLFERYSEFNGDKSKGLIFLACELIEKNATVLKEYVIKHAERWNLGNDFINWINESCAFCSTLVDRIVPGYPKDNIKQIQEELGFRDNLVVMGEYFHVWVIEGPEWVKKEFPAEEAGLNVVFTDDMTAYRDRKVRILNGAHTSTFAVAYLSGIDTVKEATEDDLVSKYMNELIFEEVCPNINLPEDEVKAFAKEILERFYNPFIKHQWMSIALNSMSKWETRVQPSFIDYFNRTKTLPQRIVFSLASMIVFYKGDRLNGEKINVADDEHILEMYKEAWAKFNGSSDSIYEVAKFVLSYERNFKMDLNKFDGLTEKVAIYIEDILNNGMKEALAKMLDEVSVSK